MAASNVSKVVLGKEVLVDLTADTVTPETLLEGTTAHDAAGAKIVGTMVQSAGGRPFATGTHTKTGYSGTNLTVTGLSFRPVMIFATCTKVANAFDSFTELDVFYDEKNSFHISHVAQSYVEDYAGNALATYSNKTYVTVTDTSFTLKRFSTFGFMGTWRWWAFGAES